MDEKRTEFMDEKIIELLNQDQRNKILENKKSNILDEIYAGKVVISGEEVEFEGKILLDNKIKIYLPKMLVEMSPELASIKYPSERRPKIIYTNESTSINFSFNHTQTNVYDKDMDKFKDVMLQIVKKMQPLALWFEDGVKQINGRNIAYFDFVAEALDTKIYNYMFLVELEGRALICSFNCTEAEMKDWKLAARAIMESFEVI